MVGRPQLALLIWPASTSFCQCARKGSSILSSISSWSMAARSAGSWRRRWGSTTSNRLQVWPASIRSMSLFPWAMLCKLHLPLYKYEGTADHCYSEPVQAAVARQLQDYQRQLKRLAEQLAAADWVSSDRLRSDTSACGKPNCYCHSAAAHHH